MDIPPILDTATFRHLVLDGANSIETSLAKLQGFDIPQYDGLEITYYGSTNNIQNVNYYNGAELVATLTLSYFVMPPTTNDANLTTVSISYP
jgi:hypothetical protein